MTPCYELSKCPSYISDESRICGGELRDSFGSLESLDSNNDGRFDKGQDCLWTLITTIDKLIEITILEYDIRSLRTYEDKMCINEFLEVNWNVFACVRACVRACVCVFCNVRTNNGAVSTYLSLPHLLFL